MPIPDPGSSHGRTQNPVSGEKITFRRTSTDTNGELLEFDIDLTPDGHVPGMHVHPAQEERFEVLENVGGDTASMRVQVTPALEMERLFETAVALAEEGRVTSKGMPKPLDLALFVRELARQEGLRGATPASWRRRWWRRA